MGGISYMNINNYANNRSTPLTTEKSIDLTDFNKLDLDTQPSMQMSGIDDEAYSNYDRITEALADNPNDYQKVWEPWITKAAVHAVATYDDGDYLAVAGGYLYDNELHIYRRNPDTMQYEHIWDSGDGIIDGDIMSLAFGDTDNNHLIEIAAGCSDGHIYVFEQQHIYDPRTHTEHRFDLVWKSPYLFKVWSVMIEDIDKDYKPDIIAGSWDNQIHIYEYEDHSGYPFSEEHWISYREVWNSGDILDGKVMSLTTGDTDGDRLPEFIVGTRNGTLYVFENDGVSMSINGVMFPLTADNKYALRWNSSELFWNPILSLSTGTLDNESGDEIGVSVLAQGAFILNYNNVTKQWGLHRLTIPIRSWEASGIYPLDHYVDSMVEGHNVTYVESSTTYYEPINYTIVGGSPSPNVAIYPFNTAMAMAPDFRYSIFNASPASLTNVSAIVDFGRHEEAIYDGSDHWDLKVSLQTGDIVDSGHIEFYVSQDGVAYQKIDSNDFTIYSGTFPYITINLENALSMNHWAYARYMKIVVYSPTIVHIDSIYVYKVNKIINTAISSEITPLLIRKGYVDRDIIQNALFISTTDGNLFAYIYNSTINDFVYYWDSYYMEGYSLKQNIWDIESLGLGNVLPTWQKTGLYFFPGPTPIPSGVTATGVGIGYIGSSSTPTIVVGADTNGDVYYINGNGYYDSALTSTYFGSINSLPGYDGTQVAPSLGDFLPNTGSEIIIGMYNGSASSLANDVNSWYANIRLDVWAFDGSTYSAVAELKDFVVNKVLYGILSTSTCPPMVSFYDYDNDNDMDMILTNGRAYFFENIGNSTNPSFSLIDGFFSRVNALAGSHNLTQPNAVDIDFDGDFDLVFGYYKEDSVGLMLQNIGSNLNPRWHKVDRFFNNIQTNRDFAYSHYYYPAIIRVSGSSQDYLLMGMFNKNTNTGNYFTSNNQHTVMLLATNPEIKIVDIDIGLGSFGASLYGPSIMESWSTQYDLDNWTLSIAFGDTDHDGNNEVIVGDFDNNMYIFEHMVNNTYKRSYRSPDIYHDILTNSSPYYWESLEGISMEFFRRVWDHVIDLQVGTDLNHNGRAEVLALTSYMLYIFEWTGQQDTYRLVDTISVDDSSFKSAYPNYETNHFTAMAASDDLDFDGYGEIVIASGVVLNIFRIYSWGDHEELTYESGTGMYYPQVLNPYYDISFPVNITMINDIIIGDTNNNGYNEIIIVGQSTVYPYIPDGRVFIFEDWGGSIGSVWMAPLNVTYANPAYTVVLDDQDFDGYDEIIVGTEEGIVIFSYDANQDKYILKQVLTSSPNLPRTPSLESTGVSGLDPESGSDMVRLPNGTIIYFYVAQHSIQYIKSNDNGDTWGYSYFLMNETTDYTGIFSYLYEEFSPSVIVHSNGTIFVAYQAYGEISSNNYRYKTLLTHYIPSTNTWTKPLTIRTSSSDTLDRIGTILLEGYHNELLVGYIFVPDQKLYLANSSTSWNSKYVAYIGSDYKAIQIDAVKLPDNRYAIAFAGRDLIEGSIQNDIFVMVGNLTPTGIYPYFDRPIKVSNSGYDSLCPSIGDLGNNRLMIMWVELGKPFGFQLYSAHSDYEGRVWSVPHYMTSFPWNIYYVYDSSKMIWNVTWNEANGEHAFSIYRVYWPSFVSWGFAGGFIYSANIQYSYYVSYKLLGTAEILNVRVSNTNWDVHREIESVHAIAAGDTDSDDRHEILFDKGNQMLLYELERSLGTLMDYNLKWTSTPLAGDINAITIGDGNGDGWNEFYVSAKGGNVYGYVYSNESQDQGNLKYAYVTEEFTGTASLDYKFDLKSYDFDHDGTEELVLPLSSNTIGVYDLSARGITYSITVSGTITSFDIGEYEDGACGIAITYDNHFEWHKITGELILKYDSSTGTTIKQMKLVPKSDTSIRAVLSVDDGTICLVYGDNEADRIEYYVESSDIDIGVTENGIPYAGILLYKNSTAYNFVIIDLHSGYDKQLDLINQPMDFSGFLFNHRIAHTVASDNDVIFYVPTADRIEAFSARYLERIWNTTIMVSGVPDIPHAFTTHDFNDDKFDDVVVTLLNGVAILDGKTGDIIKHRNYDYGSYLNPVVYDIDDDNQLDIILISYQYPSRAVVLDSQTLMPKIVKSAKPISYIIDIEPINDHGHKTVALMSEKGSLSFLYPISELHKESPKFDRIVYTEKLYFDNIQGMALDDINGDHFDDIIIGTQDTTTNSLIYVIDGRTLSEIVTIHDFGTIKGMKGILNHGSTSNGAVYYIMQDGGNYYLRMFDVDSAHLYNVNLGSTSTFGKIKGMYALDSDGDNMDELLIFGNNNLSLFNDNSLQWSKSVVANDVEIADQNADGYDDVFYVEFASVRIEVLDGLSGSTLKTYSYTSYTTSYDTLIFASIGVGNLTLDKYPDIVIGGIGYLSGDSVSCPVIAIDGNTGSALWERYLPSPIPQIKTQIIFGVFVGDLSTTVNGDEVAIFFGFEGFGTYTRTGDLIGTHFTPLIDPPTIKLGELNGLSYIENQVAYQNLRNIYAFDFSHLNLAWVITSPSSIKHWGFMDTTYTHNNIVIATEDIVYIYHGIDFYTNGPILGSTPSVQNEQTADFNYIVIIPFGIVAVVSIFGIQKIIRKRK